jgi:putative membrane protein
MNAFQLFKAEMGKLAEKKTVLISVVLMLLVPLTYAAILLSSKAGPRDNIDNLPVAVVNNDKGAELNGSQIQVGDDLVKELKVSKTLGWEFVTSEEADRGIKDNKYNMVVEIPEHFSENVTSVLEPSPKKAQLKFRQNEGLHFMGATVTDSAIETIKAQLNTKVTETYTKTLFAQLGQVNDGFKEAADGSKQINDGSGQLKDGTGQILTSLNEKSADIAKLADGAKQLNAGTGELLNNLKGPSYCPIFIRIIRIRNARREWDYAHIILHFRKLNVPDDCALSCRGCRKYRTVYRKSKGKVKLLKL